ncbi:MAG: hypothetical protein Q4C97_02880 [Bacillota bacterium]|nr:hypothetical protein [Bacillota bacterium]
MNGQKRLGIVVAATVVFGVLSKWLIGVPYMAWGYFDKLFIASFILWMFYSTILYMAIKIENGKNENYLKLGFTGVVFGLISACLKMGLDAIIEQFTKFAGNLIVTAFMMEMGILIFGSAIIFVLYICVAKKKILWNTSMKNYTLGLGGIAGVYFAVIIYYLWQLKHWMEKFADFDIVKEIGEEQGMLNLSTKYAQESTMMGMIVYVLFFIVLWIALKKNTENKEFDDKF